MRKEKILLIVISVIIGGLFYLINCMNPSPAQTSGNGNPAIILMVLVILLFGILLFLLIKIFKYHTINQTVLIVIMLVISIYLLIGFFYQRGSIIKYRNILADTYDQKFGFVDWVYIEQITSFLSIHVNRQYFNLNTYFMFLGLAIFISVSVIFIQKIIKAYLEK